MQTLEKYYSDLELWRVETLGELKTLVL